MLYYYNCIYIQGYVVVRFGMIFATRDTTWSGNTPTVCCNTFAILDGFRFCVTFGAIG